MTLYRLGLLAWILMLANALVLLAWAITNPYVQRMMHYWSGGGEPFYAIHPAIVACTVLMPLLCAGWLLSGTSRTAIDWAGMIAALVFTAGVWIWRYPPPPFLG